MKTYHQYIDGADVLGDRWIYVVRAAAMLRDTRAAFNLKRALELGRHSEHTEDVIARVAVGNIGHAELAVAAAHKASKPFRLMPQQIRTQIVLEFNQTVAARVDELLDILMAEGHPRRLAQWEISGILRGCDESTLRWHEAQLHQSFEAEGRRLELIRKPDGVVCISPPQNAAGSNAAMGVMALLPGNAIVVKAPRSSPLAVMFLYHDVLAPILEKYGAPPGTMNLICAPAGGILHSWATSPFVNDIMYFGDSPPGLRLADDCLKHGKKAILEMAGNDGLVVWRDADLDAAARALEECFYGSSQICMVPKYAIVHPEIADQFLSIFLDRVSRIRPGYPEDPEILLSPVLKVDTYFDYIAEAREAGGAVLCGARRVNVRGEPSTKGMFCEPTVIRIDGLGLAGHLSCVREETFFPVLPVVVPEAATDDRLLDDVIDFMNANKYGLRNSVWTGSDLIAHEFVNGVVNGGQLKINDSHIGFNSILATHGGTGHSGGPYGELNYVGLRTSHIQGISWGDGNPQPLDQLVQRDRELVRS